jgi:hypothetical protein
MTGRQDARSSSVSRMAFIRWMRPSSQPGATTCVQGPNWIETFEPPALMENRSTLDVFRDSGVPVSTRGNLDIRFPIEPNPA